MFFFFTSFTSVKEAGRVERKDDDDDDEKERIDEHASSSSHDEIIARSATSVPQHILGGKIWQMTKRAAKHIERRKWMNVDEIVVRQKNTERERRVNDTDDHYNCRDGFTRSRTSSRIAKIFKNRNVSRDEEEQKTIERDYALGDDEGRRG